MIVVGTHAYPAQGAAAERQRAAMAATAALGGIRAVNLQWSAERNPAPGWRTRATLRDSSVARAGRPGPVKPLAREVFDRLGEEAERCGAAWFCYLNSDVRLTRRLLDFVAGCALEAVAVSRTETDAGEPAEVTVAGVDAFLVRAAWWRRHQARFRGYLLGEPVWDNVYASLLMRFAEGTILNTPGWIFHERHETVWRRSPFAEYTRWLAALDRPHFSRWAAYHAQLLEMRGLGAEAEAEAEMARRVFRASDAAGALQAARVVRAGVRYLLAR